MTFQSRAERSDPIPLRRELPLPPGNSFVRLLTAKTIASVRGISQADVAEQMWPNDKIFAQIVTRAASTPAMTTATGWAAELVAKVVVDALAALGPASAGAQLFKQGLVLNFDGAGTISAPGLVADASNAGFVAEGQPIPVRQLAATAAQLLAHKLAAIGVLTREMVESSNAEQLIGDALIRAAGAALDVVLFDSNPADAVRPAGLRNGIAATTASSNSNPIEAYFEDVAALINAVAPVAGNGPFVLVGSPGRAAMMGPRQGNQATSVTVLGSSAVVNDLLCIASAALVSALSPEPVIETSKAATLHMDTAPVAVGTASPHRSLFQTDALALKMRWPVTWALRDARGFAWMTPTWK
jgi:hypothetical protein